MKRAFIGDFLSFSKKIQIKKKTLHAEYYVISHKSDLCLKCRLL